jgi:glycosyltransferase involved in cell wall biosynthesis
LNRRFRFQPAIDRAQLFHPTYYDLSSGLPLKDLKCPVVVTAYDFTYAQYPHLMARSSEIITSQRLMIERADHVICISKFTEEDLLARYPAAAGKTSVIHLGASFDVVEAAGSPEPEPKTFLYVGSRYGYKNFGFLLPSSFWIR